MERASGRDRVWVGGRSHPEGIAPHLIALIGLEDMIVAHSPDATLVCPVNQSHRLKELLEDLQKHGREKFL